MAKNDSIQLGEEVLIAPDLTGQRNWIKGEVIEVDTSNPFGAVVAARSAIDNDIFFGREYAFRRTSGCLQ
jgi:hypothetical protein